MNLVRTSLILLATSAAAGAADPFAGVEPRAAAAPAPATAPAAAAATRVHVVQPGETLGTISLRYYGTPAKWKTIYEANRARVPDPNNVGVGVRLDVPES